MDKKHVIVCLLNFFIASALGLLLRYAFVNHMDINFRFITHAHSHVAMLGWVYLMLYTFIIHYFIPVKKPIYNRLFWITQCAVAGMLVSFPFQGYAAVSISFSTLHIFCSYYFAYLIFKNYKSGNTVTGRLIKTAIVFMLVSTIGVWCLGPAVSMHGQASAFYQIAIQFFLHFQFNGWFLLAVLALFFHKLHLRDSPQFRRFFKLLLLATILTFAMPIHWYAPHEILLWINGIGVICQIATLLFFIKLIKPSFKKLLVNQTTITKYMYGFALLCFVLKIILQSASLIPEVLNLAYQHRNFVVGFIHLTMLGIISGFLFAFLLQNSLTEHSKILTLGMYSFIVGFVLTELILLVQGGFFYFGSGFLPSYYLILFLCSILLPLGVGCFIYNLLITAKNVSETT